MDNLNYPRSRDLRGYVVSGVEAELGAVLVFDYTVCAAKLAAWRTIVEDYGLCDTILDVRGRWLRNADPKIWGVTEPTVLEPPGREACCQWYADQPEMNEEGLCRSCASEDFWESP